MNPHRIPRKEGKVRETKVLFGVGLNRDGNPIRRTEAQLSLENLKTWAMLHHGGFTMHGHEGGWQEGDEFHVEPGVTFSIFGIELPEEETRLAHKIRDLFNQKSVLLVRARTGEAEFV